MRSVSINILIAVSLLFSAASGIERETPWEELTYPELKEIKIPDVEKVELENGLTLFLLEDRDFPLIDIRANIRAGTAHDPADKVGLADITATVIRTGGTERYPGDGLDEFLESIGASIELSTDNDRAIVTASFLSEHADEVLPRMADLVQNPIFPEDKIDLAKVEQRTAIAARNDEAFDIALREYRKVVYGPQSPYARHAEYATIEAIEQDDLSAFHTMFFRPDATVMIVTGDFKSKDMKRRIMRLFGEWPVPDVPVPEKPPLPGLQKRGIYYAPKSDVTQSTILLGHLGFRADDPDYANMRILNEILGGGFSSRIMNAVRTKRGLAYMANSIPGFNYPRPGIFGAIAGTKSESTLVTIQIMEQEIKRVTEEPVTEAELDLARSALLNSFVFNFDSPVKVAERIGFFEFHGYPLDFLQGYQKGLREATPQSILEAARKLIHPENLSVLVIGNKDQFAEPLDELGPVTELDISIPEPPSTLEIPEPTAETRQAAGDLLAKAATHAGGVEAIRNVKTLKAEMDASISIQGMKLDIATSEIRVYPDKVYSTQVLPFGQGTAIQVVNGTTGWMKDPRGLQDMPEEQMADAKAEIYRNRLWILGHYEDLDIQALDSIVEDGVEYHRVYVRNDMVKEFILFFNPDGAFIRMDYQGKGPQGPVKASMRYIEFMETDGIMFPSSIELYHDGELFLTGTTSTIEVNPDVDMTIFDKPTE